MRRHSLRPLQPTGGDRYRLYRPRAAQRSDGREDAGERKSRNEVAAAFLADAEAAFRNADDGAVDHRRHVKPRERRLTRRDRHGRQGRRHGVPDRDGEAQIADGRGEAVRRLGPAAGPDRSPENQRRQGLLTQDDARLESHQPHNSAPASTQVPVMEARGAIPPKFRQRWTNHATVNPVTRYPCE